MPDEENGLEIVNPKHEEEKPFPNLANGQTTDGSKNEGREIISPKENKAYHLVIICVVVIGVLLAADYAHMWITKETPSFVGTALELMKYVLTTALGYFFATNRKN